MSGPVDQGQTYRYRQTVSDSNGTPANAGTVTVTITLPDGTTNLPTVINSSTGVYDIAYLTTQVGLHNLKGSATGGILGSEVDVWEDAFTVETPKQLFIGVDEAAAHLRATNTISTDPDREQLRRFCLDACDAVERDLGRVVARRTVVETYNGGGEALLLRSTPALSVTTVVESGTTVTAGNYVLDTDTGMLYRGSTTSTLVWVRGRRNIVVTYVAGYTDPPRAARYAALGAVQMAWQESQQAPHPLLQEFSPEVALGFGAPPGMANIYVRAYESLRAGPQ